MIAEEITSAIDTPTEENSAEYNELVRMLLAREPRWVEDEYPASTPLVSARATKTSGVNWRQREVCIGRNNREEILQMILECLLKVFQVHGRIVPTHVTCWYDEVGFDGTEQDLTGVWLLGGFWSVMKDSELPFQFFMRRLTNWRGPLSKWRSDIELPALAESLGVIAVLPKEFTWEVHAERDLRNQSVAQFTEERMNRWGVDMRRLETWMKEGTPCVN